MSRPTRAEVWALYARSGTVYDHVEFVENVDGGLLDVRPEPAPWAALDPDRFPAAYGWSRAEWDDESIDE